MRNSVKWASGSARIRTETVGPRHDPYSRTIVEIDIRGWKYELVDCALAGMWLDAVIDGLPNVRLCEAAIFDKEAEVAVAEGVEAVTGFDPFYWTDTLWHRVENARHRNDPNYWMKDVYQNAYYGHA